VELVHGMHCAPSASSLAPVDSSTWRRPSVLRRNPPSVGIEKGKSEPREEASGPREGHESLAASPS
jgi:hypothetical protein